MKDKPPTARPEMVDTTFVKRDSEGEVVCATCQSPAAFVSTYEKTDGSGRGAWSLCHGHAPFGLIAWGNQTQLADFLRTPEQESAQ